MAVTASTLVANTSTPTSPDDLWALAYIFMANWEGGCRVRQSFLTDVSKAQSDCEQRRALILSPQRTLEVDLMIRGAEQIGYFRSFLIRASIARFLFPIHADRIALTGGGVTTVSFATNASVDRRFMVGGRIAIVRFDQNRLPTVLATDTISAISGTSFTVAGTYSSVGAGYYAYPLIEAELLLEQTTAIVMGNMMNVSMSVTESRGEFSLDAMQAIGTNPGGLTFNGYPLFNVEPNIEEGNAGMERSGEYTQVGRGKIVNAYGARGRFVHELNFLQLNRTSAFRLVRWFEAMAGRFLPFYLLSPLADLQPVSFTGTTVTVKSSMIVNDWSFYPAIGVLMVDGTYQLRLIVGTPTVSGSNYVITVATWTVTPTLATIKRMSIAMLVRFDTDEMTEDWATDGVMSSSLKMIELLDEKQLTTADIKDFSQGYF